MLLLNLLGVVLLSGNLFLLSSAAGWMSVGPDCLLVFVPC